MILCTLLFGYSETTVKQVDGQYVTIETNGNMHGGESAFVSREFDDTHSTIIAECIVDKEQPSRMKCKEFSYLAHESLSLVKDGVKAGDKVYLGLLSKSATIIAPDLTSYMETKKRLGEYNIFHPDLMAVSLYEEDNPAPKKEEFMEYCRQSFIGTLFFALDDGVYEVDCMSFALMKKSEPVSQAKEYNKPFYHRVGTIERGFFDFSDEEVRNFTAYYKRMIGVE
jgi:hypothetical protein